MPTSAPIKAPDTVRGDDSPPPRKHMARMSERRFDGTVETLCGIVASQKPPRRGAEKCPTCLDIYHGIRALDEL